MSKGVYNETYFVNNPDECQSPGVLYFIVLVHKDTMLRECFKIGITKGTSNRDVIKRTGGFRGYEPRIQTIHKDTLEAVYYMEQYLHEKFAEHSYKPDQYFGGWTECFSIDCLPEALKELKTLTS